MTRPLTAAEFQAETGVDDRTRERLAALLDVLMRWQARINLVGASTLTDPWRRHMLDSAQLVPLLPAAARTIVDMGSGAGFPGLVLAILGAGRVHLVESDVRKAAFLIEANRLTQADAVIHACRVEALPPLAADVVTARALAPLDRLLDLALPLLASDGVCLFPKGRTAEKELTDSLKKWKMTATLHPSRSDPSGIVLRLGGLRRDRIR